MLASCSGATADDQQTNEISVTVWVAVVTNGAPASSNRSILMNKFVVAVRFIKTVIIRNYLFIVSDLTQGLDKNLVKLNKIISLLHFGSIFVRISDILK